MDSNSNKEDLQEDLKKQFHEQYAQNKNESASFLMTAIMGSVAVLGAYGYVLLHSSATFVKAELVEYTPMAVVLTGVTAMLILSLLLFLTVRIGRKNRCEQLIVDKILSEADLLCDDSADHASFFPSHYQAKGKSACKFLSAHFDSLYLVLFILFLCIPICTALYLYLAEQSADCCCSSCINMISAFLLLVLNVYCYWAEYRTYNCIEQELACSKTTNNSK